MFTVCVGLVFHSIYLQFPIICSLQYSININTVKADPHSDLLHICIVKPKNFCHMEGEGRLKNFDNSKCIGTSEGGRGVTFNFLYGGGMVIFWNDSMLKLFHETYISTFQALA